MCGGDTAGVGGEEGWDGMVCVPMKGCMQLKLVLRLKIVLPK